MYPDRTYRTVKPLGAGSFGSVDLVKCETENKFFAKKNISDIVDILVGIRELDLLVYLRGLDTRGCVAGVEDYRLTTDEDKYNSDIYLEFLSGGSLETLLSEEYRNPDKPISSGYGVRKRVSEAGKLVHILNFLQKRGIYHLDIKTENVLLRKTGEMVLCDFSNYFNASEWKLNMDAPIGPQEASMYRPPEVSLMRVTMDTIPKADSWALGVLFLEIFGCTAVVDEMDTRAGETLRRMVGLVERIKTFQTTFQKRKKQGSGPPIRFDPPARKLLSRIIPRGMDAKFGADFEDSKSSENDMVWCSLFAKEIRALDFDRCLEESRRYFQLRNHPGDLEILEPVFKTILPNLLNIRYEDRWGLQRLSEEFERLTGEKNPLRGEEDPGAGENPGLWDRVPDPLWKKTVHRFLDSSEGLKITYGIKSIPYPINHLIFSKALAEKTLLLMQVSGDIPTEEGERGEFYGLLLSASALIGSEMFDFIFPHERCSWFADKPLCKIAPYVELCAKLNMGEIRTLKPTRAEIEVIVGVKNIKL
jgi:serine/threonine protein kinase